ncbi:MAG: rhizopine catabolism protein, partial [Rhodospirillaceae bacterium]|nr:rhizopine catabolism protein [Rhodospirillaceae bacterium]
MDEVFAVEGQAKVNPEVLRSMMKKSDKAGIIQLVSHLLVLAATGLGLWLTRGSWWGVPFFVLHGMVINWLYAAQHETSHGTAFRTGWINQWVGRFTGFVLLFPREYDRLQHFCHHRHTQDPEKDAELVYSSFYNGPFADVLALAGITYWIGLATSVIRHAVTGKRIPASEYYLSEDQERHVVTEARWHLALYALVVVISVMFQTWIFVIL